jgi:hypothetical protein
MSEPNSLIFTLQALLAILSLSQENGAKISTPDSAVSLDQISAASGGRNAQPDSAVDLVGPQPATPNAAAKVTSADISTKTEGRGVAVVPITGDDSCDPSQAAAHSALCRKRLETRVDSFTRPKATPVTPEGRLLLLINPSTTRSGFSVGGRQVETSGINDPNGAAEQLAGALQEKTYQDANVESGGKSNPLPPGVPAIVVAPRN